MFHERDRKIATPYRTVVTRGFFFNNPCHKFRRLCYNFNLTPFGFDPTGTISAATQAILCYPAFINLINNKNIVLLGFIFQQGDRCSWKWKTVKYLVIIFHKIEIKRSINCK